MSQADNQQRWSGQPGLYEVWYMTTNHRPTQTGFWIRYTLEAPYQGAGEPRAQLWFAFFDARSPDNNLALTQVLPIGTLQAARQPFSVNIGPSRLEHDRARGAITGGGHEVSWDLRWQPMARTHLLLPPVMYLQGGLGETTVLSPNLDVAMHGTITIDGRTYELTGEPGCQTHLWGRKHAHSWAWGHCNGFDDDRSAVLEALSVQLMRAGRALPRLTLFTLYLDGQIHRLSDFRHTLLNRCHYEVGRFAFSGYTRQLRIEGEFSCRPQDMVVAPYEDPDGEPSYCANTEVGDLWLTVYQRQGLRRWHERAHLLATHTAHFEVGSRGRDPAVTTEVSVIR